jgi:hypothetical protein
VSIIECRINVNNPHIKEFARIKEFHNAYLNLPFVLKFWNNICYDKCEFMTNNN